MKGEERVERNMREMRDGGWGGVGWGSVMVRHLIWSWQYMLMVPFGLISSTTLK